VRELTALNTLDFENKIIIEYDERHHYNNDKLREKDIIRQIEIQELYPDFKFIRIKDTGNNETNI